MPGQAALHRVSPVQDGASYDQAMHAPWLTEAPKTAYAKVAWFGVLLPLLIASWMVFVDRVIF